MPSRTPPVIDRSQARQAAAVIRRGGVIAYPTETFYGLGADAFNEEALKRVFSLKDRPAAMALPIIVRNRTMLDLVADHVPDLAAMLMEKFWPGPLTILFRARKGLPEILTAGTGRIGVRISSGEFCRLLMEAFDRPVTATSANPTGRVPARSVDEVIGYFDGRVDLVVDGGVLQGGAPSTVVDTGEGRLEIIREGAVSREVIMKVLEGCRKG